MPENGYVNKCNNVHADNPKVTLPGNLLVCKWESVLRRAFRYERPKFLYEQCEKHKHQY